MEVKKLICIRCGSPLGYVSDLKGDVRVFTCLVCETKLINELWQKWCRNDKP